MLRCLPVLWSHWPTEFQDGCPALAVSSLNLGVCQLLGKVHSEFLCCQSVYLHTKLACDIATWQVYGVLKRFSNGTLSMTRTGTLSTGPVQYLLMLAPWTVWLHICTNVDAPLAPYSFVAPLVIAFQSNMQELI